MFNEQYCTRWEKESAESNDIARIIVIFFTIEMMVKQNNMMVRTTYRTISLRRWIGPCIRLDVGQQNPPHLTISRRDISAVKKMRPIASDHIFGRLIVRYRGS